MRVRPSLVFVTLTVATLLAGTVALADDVQVYEVTVTNLTRGQVLSPPVVASHAPDAALFRLGEAAPPQLAALAEDADSAGLIALLGADPSVFDVMLGGGVIPPGESATIEIEVTGGYRDISLVAMLVSTNDTFAAVRGLRVSPARTVGAMALAYDAGSEANNESCMFIPGPPCGNPFQRATEGAEGHIHVSAGIHGHGDLDPAMRDWRNPVAHVAVRRLP